MSSTAVYFHLNFKDFRAVWWFLRRRSTFHSIFWRCPAPWTGRGRRPTSSWARRRCTACGRHGRTPAPGISRFRGRYSSSPSALTSWKLWPTLLAPAWVGSAGFRLGVGFVRKKHLCLRTATLGHYPCSLFRAAAAAISVGSCDNTINRANNNYNHGDSSEDAAEDNYELVHFPVEVILALPDAVPVLSVDDWIITTYSGAGREGSLDLQTVIVRIGAVVPNEIEAGSIVVGHVEHTIIVWMSECYVGLAAVSRKEGCDNY